MKPRRIALAVLVLVGVLPFISDLLGNIAASLLQDKLKDNPWLPWLILVPYSVIVGVLIGLELRDRLQAPRQDRRLAFDRRNRQAMLEKVRAIWIIGVLQRSLAHEVPIALDLAERAEAVVRPLDLLVQRLDGADRPLPPGTRLIDVFDASDRALLILGAPGAGKTTLLLELAQDLLARAVQDSDCPIPVVFPLSSWAEQRRPLVAWLVDALNEQYDVPRKTGQAWVEADQILPLLDGLDEVAAEHRAACVEAINTFRQAHGLLPLVVCSRAADYETLGTRLRLQGAVVIQALTPEQVNAYLAHIGQPMAAVRQALQEDPTLWELLDTPLMLHIVSLTYAGQPVGALRMSGTVDARRQQLFAAYVERMFQRRGVTPRDLRQQTVRWLAWLAWQMGHHSQSVFYLERMQPDWLPPGQRWIPTTGVAWGVGLGLGLGVGLGLGLGAGLGAGLAAGLGLGLSAGSCAYSRNIIGAETVHWSWLAVRSGLSLILALGLGAGLAAGLTVGLTVGLGAGLAAGLSSGEITTRTAPNEGIHRSAQMALLVWLGFGLGGGLGAGLALGLALGLSSWLGLGLGGGLGGGLGAGLALGLGGGLGAGLAAGLDHGGRTCLQHVILRLLLVRNGSAPWRYVEFLDYAAERIFLRKIGGGYSFAHRLLQDHFAALYKE